MRSTSSPLAVSMRIGVLASRRRDAADLQAVQPWEHDIQDNYVRVAAPGKLKAGLAVHRSENGVTLSFQVVT